MNILVCIKQVPGTSQVEIDEKTGVLKRDGVESKMNPFDLYALETALRLKQQYGATVTALTMEREVILAAEQFLGRKFPDNSSNAYLLLTFDGASKEEIELAYDNVAHTCLDAGALDVFLSNTQERNESIWSARGAFLEAIKASTTEMDECDVVVPRNNVAEFVLFSHKLQEKYNIRIRSFGHAGDGNLHIYVLRDALDEAAWKKKLSDVFNELYAKSRELRGQVSGEHGIGYAKKPYLAQSLSPEVLRIMAGIKQVFDPKCILNPAKVVTEEPVGR